jgi:hypothetical protein
MRMILAIKRGRQSGGFSCVSRDRVFGVETLYLGSEVISSH